jgi:hypothetical protein
MENHIVVWGAILSYIAEDLKISEIWKSPGGGAKRFVAGKDSDFVLKWQK